MLTQLVTPQFAFPLCIFTSREHLSLKSVTQSEQNIKPSEISLNFSVVPLRESEMV